MTLASYPQAALAVALGMALIWLVRYSHAFSRYKYPLPPGPPGRFLVGNLGHVSIDSPEKDYLRWGQAYGQYNKHPIRYAICVNFGSFEAYTSGQIAMSFIPKSSANT